MALKLKIDLNRVPPWGRYAIAVGVPILILVIFFFFYWRPASEEINKLKKEIAKQQSEIENAEAKLRKLPELKKRYEKLSEELELLKRQLPEEKEVTNLLKQVSDLGVESGLVIRLWKPGKRRLHQSSIVYEIPVTVEMVGTYHNLGRFFSALTGLDRIVNISDLKMGNARPATGEAIVDISFNAKTFSAVPEEELKKKVAKKRRKRRR